VQADVQTCTDFWDITPYQSLMHACWYTIMTMTTVGYGDITPKTSYGALAGYFTMLAGMRALRRSVPRDLAAMLAWSKLLCAGTITIALPISVIASKLSDVYKRVYPQ
jgi:hypothetical protein